MSTYIRIQDAAVRLTLECGLPCLLKDNVAKEAGVTPSLLYHYFESMAALRTRVVEIAIDTDDPELLAQGILAMHPLALKAPLPLRKRALGIISIDVLGA